jgi:hypothetical protein
VAITAQTFGVALTIAISSQTGTAHALGHVITGLKRGIANQLYLIFGPVGQIDLDRSTRAPVRQKIAARAEAAGRTFQIDAGVAGADLIFETVQVVRNRLLAGLVRLPFCRVATNQPLIGRALPTPGTRGVGRSISEDVVLIAAAR